MSDEREYVYVVHLGNWAYGTTPYIERYVIEKRGAKSVRVNHEGRVLTIRESGTTMLCYTREDARAAYMEECAKGVEHSMKRLDEFKKASENVRFYDMKYADPSIPREPIKIAFD